MIIGPIILKKMNGDNSMTFPQVNAVSEIILEKVQYRSGLA